MAHAAAGGTLQARLKTAAGENATTRTLGKGLGNGSSGCGSGGDCMYPFKAQPAILFPCFALLSFAVEDAWTP